MANFDGANKAIDGINSELIGIIAGKDEEAFHNVCLKCEGVFKEISDMHPETMEQEEKRNAVNVLRRLKDACLQLINIKKVVFDSVNLDMQNEPEKQEEKVDTSKALTEHVDAKVLKLTKNNDNKRAA